MLEAVANTFKMTKLDMVKVNQHIKTILNMLRDHRQDAGNFTTEDLKEDDIAKHLNVDVIATCVADGQKHRGSHADENLSQVSRSLIIPYLDSIFSSLHPSNMKDVSLQELNESTSSCETFYNLKG